MAKQVPGKQGRLVAASTPRAPQGWRWRSRRGRAGRSQQRPPRAPAPAAGRRAPAALRGPGRPCRRRATPPSRPARRVRRGRGRDPGRASADGAQLGVLLAQPHDLGAVAGGAHARLDLAEPVEEGFELGLGQVHGARIWSAGAAEVKLPPLIRRPAGGSRGGSSVGGFRCPAAVSPSHAPWWVSSCCWGGAETRGQPRLYRQSRRVHLRHRGNEDPGSAGSALRHTADGPQPTRRVQRGRRVQGVLDVVTRRHTGPHPGSEIEGWRGTNTTPGRLTGCCSSTGRARSSVVRRSETCGPTCRRHARGEDAEGRLERRRLRDQRATSKRSGSPPMGHLHRRLDRPRLDRFQLSAWPRRNPVPPLRSASVRKS